MSTVVIVRKGPNSSSLVRSCPVGRSETTIGENQFPSRSSRRPVRTLPSRAATPSRLVEAGGDVLVDDWTHEGVGVDRVADHELICLLDDLGGEVVGNIAYHDNPAAGAALLTG